MQLVGLVEYARREGLTYNAALRKVVAKEVLAIKVAGRWVVLEGEPETEPARAA